MGIESLKNNYGNYKQFVDDWDLKARERKKDNNLVDMSTLFEGIDISEFPETAEEILQVRIQQLRQNQIFLKKIWMLNQKMGRNYC